MGVLARLFGRRFARERGMLAWLRGGRDEDDSHLPPVKPTAGTRTFEMPKPTAGTRPLSAPGSTAGTRSWRDPGGTPSTQRLHNPRRPGR